MDRLNRILAKIRYLTLAQRETREQVEQLAEELRGFRDDLDDLLYEADDLLDEARAAEAEAAERPEAG
ncbi:hypothetical protein M8C13_18720 [Crossiella sp. SN42]|uniref:hypothetical protein n=1 Tax=Crossiella sp. SN42 TaxID=2944808 RepID=UPI00207C6220|nr:hypothetical protein [Crossiella sp. SN42]MCO1577792.1 hypothetical protein [Crossiella sp. SN42]